VEPTAGAVQEAVALSLAPPSKKFVELLRRRRLAQSCRIRGRTRRCLTVKPQSNRVCWQRQVGRRHIFPPMRAERPSGAR
jgi:hypothetical protein